MGQENQEGGPQNRLKHQRCVIQEHHGEHLLHEAGAETLMVHSTSLQHSEAGAVRPPNPLQCD